VARNYLIAGLLGLAALTAACSGGDEAVADQAQETRVAAARARSDSIRRARAQLAANPAAGVQVAVTSAAATPAGAGVNEVQREVFAYSGGPRDPFASLMNLKAVGPELGNLQLVGIYLDLRTSDNSVAVLREKDSGKRYKLHAGDHLGRMQVVQIGAKDVVFRIEDFGYERQETLSLRKQEEMTP
jgi:hypothetical protein